MSIETDPEVTTLYIVRHGESEGNRLGIIQGQLNFQLTEKGRAEAEILALHMISRQYPISVVYTSDLIRASDTARIIADILEVPYIIDRRLIERNCGEFEGCSPDQVASIAEHRKIYASLSKEEQYRYHFGKGAESDEELATRAIPALRDIREKYSGQHVAVVTHAGVVRACLSHMGYTTTYGAFPNTGYARIIFTNDIFQVKDISAVDPHQTNADIA